MFNWLGGFFSWTFSGIDDVKNWIVHTLQAIASWVTGLINDAWKGITAAWNEAVALYNQAIKYIVQLYTLARSIIDIEIKAVETWVSGLYGNIINWVNGIIKWVNGLISSIEKWITSEINTLYQWVITNIWDPIWNTLTGAVNWISKYGYWVYYMLTHPDQLAKLIGSYVLREFFNLGHKYARSIGRWVIHAMMSAAHDVAGLIEDFITSLI